MYPVPKVWFLMLILNHRPKSGLRGLTYPHIHFSSCCMYTRIKYLSISFYNKFSCNFNWECSILDFHLAMFTEVKILIIFPLLESVVYPLWRGVETTSGWWLTSKWFQLQVFSVVKFSLKSPNSKVHTSERLHYGSVGPVILELDSCDKKSVNEPLFICSQPFAFPFFLSYFFFLSFFPVSLNHLTLWECNNEEDCVSPSLE